MAHEADTETSPAQVQPEDDSENLVGDTKAPRLNRPPSVGPGGLVDRVTKTINDFGNTITNLTGGGGPKPGQDAGPSAGSAGVSTGRLGRLPAAPGRLRATKTATDTRARSGQARSSVNPR